MGAGLGGGSADAAAVLVGAPRLAGIDVDAGELAALGRVARRRRAVLPRRRRADARARHRRRTGARHAARRYAVVIATPPFGCSTAAVYRAWDKLGGPAGRQSISTGSRRCATTSNAPRTRSSRGSPRSRCWSSTPRARPRCSPGADRRTHCCSAPTRGRSGAGAHRRGRGRSDRRRAHDRSRRADRRDPGSGRYLPCWRRCQRGLLQKLLVLLLAHALAALLDQGSHGGWARYQDRPCALRQRGSYRRRGRGWCNGSTRSFGVLCRGSNPRPRATHRVDLPGNPESCRWRSHEPYRPLAAVVLAAGEGRAHALGYAEGVARAVRPADGAARRRRARPSCVCSNGS